MQILLTTPPLPLLGAAVAIVTASLLLGCAFFCAEAGEAAVHFLFSFQLTPPVSLIIGGNDPPRVCMMLLFLGLHKCVRIQFLITKPTDDPLRQFKTMIRPVARGGQLLKSHCFQ